MKIYFECERSEHSLIFTVGRSIHYVRASAKLRFAYPLVNICNLLILYHNHFANLKFAVTPT
jgi:hypothetical protein